MPFTSTPPADLALSPEADTLYLFGNGWLTTLSTAKLQALGIQPVSPLPAEWIQATDTAGKSLPLYVYPSPTFEQDDTALLQLIRPSERYQTTDGGRSWTLQIPADNLSNSLPSYIGPLSFSPDFAQDQTVVSPDWQSTDGGESWVDWSPLLAFTSDRSGNREIYTMNYEGEALQQITNDPAADENSAWSPAWTRLAFQSDRTGNWDIFSLRADCPAECDLQQLTDDPADEMLPAWSPDGRLIAFVSTRDGNPEIYVMNQDGSNQRRLTFNEAGDWRPAWLRDSQRLIFASGRNGNNDIYQITVPPADEPPLTTEPDLVPLITDPSDDRDPAVSLDESIYFLSDRDGLVQTYRYGIYSYNPSDEVKAYNDLPQSDAHPSPEPSGSLLVSREQNGQTNLYRIWPYSEDTPLTDTPGFNGQPAGGPVWWQPDPATSREWLAKHP